MPTNVSLKHIFEDPNAWLQKLTGDRKDILALCAATLMGLIIRAFFMFQPMRLDESYTFLYYLNEGRNPFYYNVPNNHVFHTLLAKLAVLLGGMEPAIIRIPAFLAGVLCIPAMYFVAKSFHPRAGLLAALGMAVFPYMILYSTMARGYSLIVLFTLLLILAGQFYLEKPSRVGWVLFSVFSALGLYTIPTMIFPLAGMYLWLTLALLIKFRNLGAFLRGFLLPTLGLTTLLTLLCYIPVLIASGGAGTLFSNQYVNARPWNEFLPRIAPHLRLVFDDFFRDVPTAGRYIGFLLAGCGVIATTFRRQWAGALLIPAIIAGAIVIFFAKQAIPFARTWIYLIPFFLLFADLGYSFLTERLKTPLNRLLAILTLFISLIFAGRLAAGNAIAGYADTGSFPEAQQVARTLKPMLTGNEFIAVMDTANFPLYYYLCAEYAPAQKPNLDPKTVRRYFVVQNSWYKLSHLTKQPVTPLYNMGDASIYTSISPNERIWPGFVFECGGRK